MSILSKFMTRIVVEHIEAGSAFGIDSLALVFNPAVKEIYIFNASVTNSVY
jgi:hypothetical protein